MAEHQDLKVLKWKMALVAFAAVYPLALLVTVVLAPRTAAWPLLLRPVAFAGAWCR